MSDIDLQWLRRNYAMDTKFHSTKKDYHDIMDSYRFSDEVPNEEVIIRCADDYIQSIEQMLFWLANHIGVVDSYNEVISE